VLDLSSSVADEFAARPFGDHSPQLQALLETMRSVPIPGKSFLYMSEPHREWQLARMSTTEPLRLEVAPDHVFTSIEDAERDVFTRRLTALRGEPVEAIDYPVRPDSPSVLGYLSADSVRAGGSLTCYISSERDATFRVEVVRLRTPEVGPKGEPFRVDRVESPAAGEYPSVRQWVHPGSWVGVDTPLVLDQAFSISARIYPTLLASGRQAVASLRTDDGGKWTLAVLPDGTVEWSCESGTGIQTVLSDGPVAAHQWSQVVATVDGATGLVSVGVSGLTRNAWAAPALRWAATTFDSPRTAGTWWVVIGAEPTSHHRAPAASLSAEPPCTACFNGRIESPRIHPIALNADDATGLVNGTEPGDLVADWDFGQGISTERVTDRTGRHHGTTVNLPTRAVRGSTWTGDHLDWRAAPDEYAAIHFHEDDLADAGWEPTFQLRVPESWSSGCYAVRVSAGDDEFFVPFFVRPAVGATADVAFVAPTATYAAYANMRLRLFGQAVEMQHGRLTVGDATDLLLTDHPELGASTYDTHRDGSLVCYSSMRRPVTNFRPKGRIYKFCQDLLITSWLDHEGVGYDVLTDEDIHREGVAAIADYRVLVSASHPEYVSGVIEDAIEEYLGRGGRLMYIGGNGYYNAAEFHETLPGTVEVRRPGMQALWPIDHTEGNFSFTGGPAGPFAKAGRRSEPLVGVAFITQGFDACSYYRRTPDSHDDRAAFVFDGVDDEIIGDFGLLQGGAAGYEIDRFDLDRGSPPHALVLARSEAHSNVYDLMIESIIDVLPNRDPDSPEPIRADLVFFETANGGAVFSVGSIAWSGSLAWNGYDNNVAAVTRNVLRRFRDPDAFDSPLGLPSSTDRSSR
jgi:N,N-dimethylformamidase